MIFGGGSGGAIGTGIVYSLYDNFSATADKIQGKWTKLDMITNNATARIQTSMNKMRSGFMAMIAGAVMLAPIIMGLGKSMDFNATMSEVYAKAQVTSIATQRKLADEAMRLGEATKFSAKQAAEGQVFLAQAGFKVNDIMSAMPGVLNLAAAGNLDLARSADIASNVLTAMGLQASEMTRVADALALGASSANVNVEMLGDTFAYAAASARGLGWSLEETTAMAGLLGNIGIQGSAAGTSIMNFNRFLSKLDDSKLAKLNMSMSDIQDSAGNMRSVPLVFAKILDSMKGMGNLQQQQVLGELFGPRGTRAIAGFQAAMNSGMDFTAFVEKLDNASGSAEAIANQMMDNLKGDLTILGSVWETTLIKVGNAVEPLLRPLVQGFSKFLALLGKIANHPIGKWIIRLTAAGGALAVALGLVVVVTNLANVAAGKAAIAFASMGKTQIAAAFASKGLVAGLRAVTKAAFSAVLSLAPILIIGMAIAGVVWVLRKAVKSFDEVLAGTAAPAQGFLGFLQKLGGIMRAVAEIWKSANNEGFTMSESLAAALDKLGILDTAIAIGTWIVRLKAFFKGIGEGVKAAWNFIKPVFKVIGQGIDWVRGLFDKFGWTMSKNVSPLNQWAEAGKILGIVIMATLVPAFISLAISVIAATYPILLIIGIIVGIIWLFKNWGKVVDWFKKIFGQAWDWIKEKALSFWDGIKNFGARIKDWGVNLVTKMKEGIKSAWQNFKDWLRGLIDGLLAPIKETLAFFGVGKGEGVESNLSVEGDVKNINAEFPTQLATANAQSNTAGYQPPLQPVTKETHSTKEVLKNVNLNMDGTDIRKQIDIGTQEDLERQ